MEADWIERMQTVEVAVKPKLRGLHRREMLGHLQEASLDPRPLCTTFWQSMLTMSRWEVWKRESRRLHRLVWLVRAKLSIDQRERSGPSCLLALAIRTTITLDIASSISTVH